MRLRFKGQLLVPSEPGPGLRVDLEVAGHRLAVESDGADLGAWPLDAVRVRRLEGDTFAMTVAGEDLHFIADDTISFAYTAVPAIESMTAPGSSRSRFRNWLGRRSDDAPRPRRHREEQPEVTSRDGRVKIDAPPDEPPMSRDEPPVTLNEPSDQPPSWLGVSPVERDGGIATPEPAEDDVIDVSLLADEFLPIAPEPDPRTRETQMEQTIPTVQTCRGVTADGDPCRSPILTSAGYCFSHDPDKTVEDGYRRAQEARARLRRKGTAKLNRVYGRLDKAMRQVERGELEPDVAMAMAQLARTMCAILDLDGTPRRESPDSAG